MEQRGEKAFQEPVHLFTDVHAWFTGTVHEREETVVKINKAEDGFDKDSKMSHFFSIYPQKYSLRSAENSGEFDIMEAPPHIPPITFTMTSITPRSRCNSASSLSSTCSSSTMGRRSRSNSRESSRRRPIKSVLVPLCFLAVPFLCMTAYLAPVANTTMSTDSPDFIFSGGPGLMRSIDLAKRQVEQAVTGVVVGSKTELKFCDPNLPTQIETVDVIPAESSSETKDIKVCVVVNTFGIGGPPVATFKSLSQQTHDNIEIVAVDDASDERISKFLERRVQTGMPLKIITLSQHASEGQSYNIGLGGCSSSEYVLFNDSMTSMEEDAIATMLTHAKHMNADIVFADYNVKLTDDIIKESPDSKEWNKIPPLSSFNIFSMPDILDVSPVSWRKLYRKRLFDQVDFSEGYFGSAEEAFHWSTIAKSSRITKVDRVLFHHEDQGKKPLELASFFSNMNHVGKMLFEQGSTESDCLPSLAQPSIASKYFSAIKKASWISQLQFNRPMQHKFERLLHKAHHGWSQSSNLPSSYWETLNANAKITTSIDLTIIMPTYNVKDMVGKLLQDMFATLNKSQFSFEVICVDDGSTDGTQDVLLDFQKGHEKQMYVLDTPGTGGGAGRARNIAIPLMEGRFVYFVDADDGYDFTTLRESVAFATQNSHDLLIFPYETEKVDPNRSTKGEMMSSDKKVWEEVWTYENRTHALQREAAFGLINYPWKQLTSSRLMRDSDVFFGPTPVHNDVQFHWTSIAASKSLHFYHKLVCTHRSFDESLRGQLTSSKSATRMSVFDALGMTQRALARQNIFKGHNHQSPVFLKWTKFSRDVMSWASKRVPKELEDAYKLRWKKNIAMLTEMRRPATFKTLPFWQETGQKEATVPAAKQTSETVTKPIITKPAMPTSGSEKKNLLRQKLKAERAEKIKAANTRP